MTPTTSGRKVGVLESIGAHLLLTLAVCFALYPVLWVVSLAFSGVTDLEPRVLPLPIEPTLEHLRGGILIAVPTAYALARFEFVGKDAGLRTLLATQMFPAVASAIPLYLILDALGLLGSRSGLVLCYATTSVPFAIFQLRGAFETIPKDSPRPAPRSPSPPSSRS